MNSPEAWGNATHTKKNHNEGAEHPREQYGFKISLIDDNSVHVRDAVGREAVFEFPLGNISLEKYDRFIEQLMDTSRPPPSVDAIELAVGKPLSMGPHPVTGPNSPTYPRTWEQHAENFGMSTDEMKAM